MIGQTVRASGETVICNDIDAHRKGLGMGMECVELSTPREKIKNHQLSWWFDGEPLKAVLKDSATFGMGLWDH